VIGNPPYLNIDDTWGKGDPRQRYIKRIYAEAYNDKTDILFCFLVRARNSDIWRYEIRDSGEMLLYLEDFRKFDDLPPEVEEHLKAHQKELKERAAYQRGDCEWWKYTWPLHKERAHRAKLLCPYLATRNRFALDSDQKYLGLTDTTILYDADQPEDMRYLMGLLNSRLLSFRFASIGKLKSGGILEYFWNSVSKLPIRRVDFSNGTDKDRHDRMVSLVERMLELHKQLATAKTGDEKTRIERQIDATDAQIEKLVYELYGLSEDEIKIVEAASR
jgi:hypothetical protein